MSNASKRIFKKLISRIGILFFLLAAGMLYWQLRKYPLVDILAAITNIPKVNVILACVICLIGYIVLSCYDFLALRYVGKKLSWWKWMLAGLIGFAISNNAGHAAISGGAIRYRLYTRWRIRAGEIVKMITFSGTTYFLGATSLVALGYFLLPEEGAFATSTIMHLMLAACSAFIVIYFLACAFLHGKTFKFLGLSFKVPSLRMAIAQTTLGAVDSILAGLVLYLLSFHTVSINVIEFVSIFVVAQATGIFAQVPGGIGVFESVFLLAVPDGIDKASLFGCMMAFRIIYFVLPLMGTGALFLLYERNLYNKMKKWKIFQIPKKRGK